MMAIAEKQADPKATVNKFDQKNMFNDIKYCWVIFYPGKLKMTFLSTN